jgi:5-methylcytosine-specific restriction endonuclease McrA
MALPAEKRCSKCGETKPRGAFYYALPPKREYISSYCKPCNYIQSSRWAKNNPHRSREMGRESKRRMRLDPERLEHEKRRRRLWYGNLPEEKKRTINAEKSAHYKESYHNNPEYRDRMRTSNIVWIKNNRERFAQLQLQNCAKRRAILAGSALTEKITVEDINQKKAHQLNRCFYCGSDISVGHHMDHFLSLSCGGAHTKSNLVLTCPPCNRSKHSSMPGEFCITPKPWAPTA